MLLYQFDAAVSRGFYMERFLKGKRVRGSGFGVRGSGHPWDVLALDYV